MEIVEAVTTEFPTHDVKTPVSQLRGTFESDGVHVIVITNGGDFAGVVTRKALLSSHHPPEETALNVSRDPPQVQRTADVREVARLMVESGLSLLPVFEGEQFHGVVTERALLDLVRDNLDALDVDDVFTRDLIAVDPETTLGEVLHQLREGRISRLPVLDPDDGTPVGLVSIQDLVAFTTRAVDREQGGAPDAPSRAGGGQQSGQAVGGYGERAGTQARLLDLPVRDVMTTPVETTTAETSLGDAVERMLTAERTSLVVVNRRESNEGDEGPAIGILTTTDALQALTWSPDDHLPVQVFNVELLDALSRETIAERIEAIDAEYQDMYIEEANVVFHEHDESRRGVPLIQCTIRLFTDRGRFSGTAEGYGADRSFDEAADVLEANVLESKGRATDIHTRKASDRKREELERLLGWWLEAP